MTPSRPRFPSTGNGISRDYVFGESFLWTLHSSVADQIHDFPLDLPDDPCGVIAGRRYRAHLKAGRGHGRSTGFTFESPKFGRAIESQSKIEAALARILHLNPYVVDVRDHYVISNPSEIANKLRTGQRIRKSATPTIDLVATFRHPGPGFNLSYHGFSVKSSETLRESDVETRVEKDKTFCTDNGWRWSLFTEREVNDIAVATAFQAISWAKGKRISARVAYDFAYQIVKQRPSDRLDAVLNGAARNLDLGDIDPVSAFAQAVLNGFLVLDPNSPLKLDQPLCLRSWQ
jgi:hypothetical protein